MTPDATDMKVMARAAQYAGTYDHNKHRAMLKEDGFGKAAESEDTAMIESMVVGILVHAVKLATGTGMYANCDAPYKQPGTTDA